MSDKISFTSLLKKVFENERITNQGNFILSIITTIGAACLYGSWQSGNIHPLLEPLMFYWSIAFSFTLIKIIVAAYAKVIEAKIPDSTIDEGLKSDIKKSIEGFKYVGNLVSQLVVNNQLLEQSIRELVGKLFKEEEKLEQEPEPEPSPGVVTESREDVRLLGPDPDGVFGPSDG